MIQSRFLGTVAYQAALELMNQLRSERLQNIISDQLLFFEHPPVITMGRRDASGDFVLSPEEIRQKGIDLVQTDRGGKLTYHGPGQLVIYFIFDIAARKLPIDKFVWLAEEGLRLLLADYDIVAKRDKKNPGLWLGNKKIASLGFHIHKGITTHGIALNVWNDLTPFSFMVPCGVAEAAVTSVLLETGKKEALQKVGKKLLKVYGDVFENETIVAQMTPD